MILIIILPFSEEFAELSEPTISISFISLLPKMKILR